MTGVDRLQQPEHEEHASLFRRLTRKLRRRQLDKLMASRQELFDRMRSIPDRMRKLTRQLELLIDLADDYSSGRYREVRWHTLAIAVAAALYFVSPADVIPDHLPGIGQLDDIVVIAIALRTIRKDLRKYAAWRGHEPDDYF
jgi:uncharacterized membrane protein YkvA (DUF1232 family)